MIHFHLRWTTFSSLILWSIFMLFIKWFIEFEFFFRRSIFSSDFSIFTSDLPGRRSVRRWTSALCSTSRARRAFREPHWAGTDEGMFQSMPEIVLELHWLKDTTVTGSPTRQPPGINFRWYYVVLPIDLCDKTDNIFLWACYCFHL